MNSRTAKLLRHLPGKERPVRRAYASLSHTEKGKMLTLARRYKLARERAEAAS